MRLLFAINEPYLPETIGGGVLAIHHLAVELHNLGHFCEVVCCLGPSARQLAYRLVRKFSSKRWNPYAQSQTHGYRTFRAPNASALAALLQDRLGVFRPDVVITQGAGREALAQEVLKAGYPVLIRAVTAECVQALEHAFESSPETARLLKGPRTWVVSNSKFIAAYVRERLHMESPMIYPLIRFGEVQALDRSPEWVSFVNPHKLKGLEIALSVAALLRHRTFVFAESWALSRAGRQELKARLKGRTNIRFRPRSADLRDVYQRTVALLAPSQWQEAFGRVVVEAGANGIPTVASRIGGIPEALGEGGVLLSPDEPPERWAATLEQLLTDRALYEHLSARALANAARPDLSASAITEQFLTLAKALA